MLGHVLLVVVVVACSSKRDEVLAADPAEASTQIKRLAAKSCTDFARSLDLLSRSDVHGRLLLGLVDDAIESARTCPATAITGKGAAQQLARAQLAGETEAALAFLADRKVDGELAIRLRRAEAFERLDRFDDAIRELDVALSIAPDEETARTRRLCIVAAGARAARFDDVVRMIADAPITERPGLSHRAAVETRPPDLAALVRVAGPELANAIANRLEESTGPTAALAARERAVDGAPDVAEYRDGLARAQIAAGKLDEALVSWDRAIELAPAQGAYRITPIRALVIAGELVRARERATALATFARDAKDLELLVTASAGAATAQDTTLALELAREAHERKPGDGQLVFGLAEREAAAGQKTAAAERYAELLACGAHGRPWHRHEVAAKLVDLGDAARLSLDKPRTCETVDGADLASYVEAIRSRLR